jgi:methylmalonyl-CoA carboxyltransferase large subunit
MKTEAPEEIASLLLEIREQLKALSSRVANLETAAEPKTAAAPASEAAAPAAPAEPEPISEEHLLALSAALAAAFGVRVRVRAIRLISSPAWAQQGRVSIQASHRLG